MTTPATNPPDADAIRAALRGAAARYRPLGRAAYYQALGKLRGDPVYAAVLPHLPPRGTLLDLGCGEGYLLAAAAVLRPGLTLHGIDHDPRRLARARAALGDHPAATLDDRDAAAHPLPPANVITCLDVLHYLPHPQQDALLTNMATPGSSAAPTHADLDPAPLTILIRDLQPGRGWRSRLTLWSERRAVRRGRHKGQGVFPRPMDDWATLLRGHGLTVTIHPCRHGTPFANQLLVAVRGSQTD